MTGGKALLACVICVTLAFAVAHGFSLGFTWLCLIALMAWGMSIPVKH